MPSLKDWPKWPPCPGCYLAQHSNPAHGHDPELRIPAPLRCGEGNGTLISVVGDGCTLTKIKKPEKSNIDLIEVNISTPFPYIAIV